MPELSWTPLSPLHKVPATPRYGDNTAPEPGVRVSELVGFSLAQVMARRGQWAETARVAFKLYEVDAPVRPAATLGTAATLIWSGPDQFMALLPGSSRHGAADAARAAFAGVASVSEQSDGRCLLQLSGRRVRDCLAKLCSIDVHESAFAVGAAAALSIDHSTVNMWRGADALDGDPVFNVLMFSSFAESLWHTILEAACEYGVDPTGVAKAS